MAGFVIHQSAGIDDVRMSLSRAHLWMSREKGLPIVGSIDEPMVSVVKFGRRCAGSAGIAQLPDGWIASIGFWSHSRCHRPNNNCVLLKLLQDRGSSIFDELDGMYAIAWYKRSTRTLTIATDHVGRLHVFYAMTSHGIFVSSSCAALARAVPSEPDPIAIYEMLATGTIYEDRTPFLGIRRVPAASVYVFRDGMLHRKTTSWNGLLSQWSPGSSEPSVADVTEILENSARTIVTGFGSPLTDLTGGLDSRLVLGLMLRLHRRVAVTVSGRCSDRDVRVAKKLARTLGLQIEVADPTLTHHGQQTFDDVLRAAALTEGAFDPILYAVIGRVHAVHAETYDLNLNGYGGELLRNMWWNRSHLSGAAHNVVNEGALRFVRGALVPAIVKSEFRFDLGRHFRGVVERCLSRVDGAPAYAQLEHLYLVLRMQCWLGSMTSATNQIWPAASPLFQRASLKAILRLNPLLRLRAKAMHDMFALCSRRLATFPLASGFPPMSVSLPNTWRFVPGLMHLPFAQWRRWRAYRRGSAGYDQSDAVLVRNLFATGGADYLQFPTMALGFCLERSEFDRCYNAARKAGNVPQSIVGRQIALESVYRAASAAS